MKWIELFKPNLAKIVLALVIFISIMAFPIYRKIGPICDIGFNCPEPTNKLLLFGGFFFVASLSEYLFYDFLGISAYYAFPLAFIFTFFIVGIFAYTTSCLIVKRTLKNSIFKKN